MPVPLISRWRSQIAQVRGAAASSNLPVYSDAHAQIGLSPLRFYTCVPAGPPTGGLVSTSVARTVGTLPTNPPAPLVAGTVQLRLLREIDKIRDISILSPAPATKRRAVSPPSAVCLIRDAHATRRPFGPQRSLPSFSSRWAAASSRPLLLQQSLRQQAQSPRPQTPSPKPQTRLA